MIIVNCCVGEEERFAEFPAIPEFFRGLPSICPIPQNSVQISSSQAFICSCISMLCVVVRALLEFLERPVAIVRSPFAQRRVDVSDVGRIGLVLAPLDQMF